MAGEPGSRFDKVSLWMMFVLPSTAGTLSWMVRDRLEPGLGVLTAMAGWGCGLLCALTIIFDYYRRPPGDR